MPCGHNSATDVSFVSWSRLPAGQVPDQAMLALAPDLAIEVISPSNTRREMERKLAASFEAGAREVWYVYPRPPPEVWVYSSPEQYRVIGGEEVLTSAAVLPGFELDLKRLFSRGPGSTHDGP